MNPPRMRARPRRNRSPLYVVLGAALAATALVGCTSGPPSAKPVATELAEALSTLDVSGLPLKQDPQLAADQLAAAFAGLGDLQPRVRAGEPQQDDEAKTATSELSYSWELVPGVEWDYRTTADLAYSEQNGWQVDWDPSLLAPQLVEGERLHVTRQQAPRADILGADGATIVTARPVVRVGIDKTQVSAARSAASARALAKVVQVEPGPFVERVESAGPKAFVEAIVLRTQGSEPVPVDAIADITGAVMLDDELPLAPTAEFARPILGSVGEVTAEVVEKSEARLVAGDQAGLSGLQERYDEQLGGEPGITLVALPPEEAGPAAGSSDDSDTDDSDTDGSGADGAGADGDGADGAGADGAGADGAGADAAEPRVLFEKKPVPGKPLRITLDPGMQAGAESLLADVGPASAIVAVRPSTGALVAAASGPGGGGLSTATVGRFAPGSTFKVVSTLALLRAGLDPTSTVACTPTIGVDGKAFKNYDDYPADRLGRITLRQAVANSCNTAFIANRSKAGQVDLQQAAAALGFGVDHHLGFPVFLGSVPDSTGSTDHAASMIGQARVVGSPLAMAGVAASVAQGERVVPYLVVGRTAPNVGVADPLTPKETRWLTSMMRAVVSEGSGAFLADLPGPPVAAKTGTAEYGEREPLRTHAWMIGFQGDLAVAVFVQDGESGSQTAGPLLEDFLRAAR